MKIVVKATLLVLFLGFSLQAHARLAHSGKLMIGDKEFVHLVANTSVAGPDGRELYLGHHVTFHTFLLPYYVESKGLVYGIYGNSERYIPLPTVDQLTDLQVAGRLPAELPKAELSIFDYVYGFSLELFALGIIVAVYFRKEIAKYKSRLTVMFIVGSLTILIAVIALYLLKNDIALAFLIGFLSIPFLLYLLHMFRDHRGKARNINGLCYQCGGLMRSRTPVYRYAGNPYVTRLSYNYCEACANAERYKRKFTLVIAVIDLILIVAAGTSSVTGSEFVTAVKLIALFTVVIVVINTIIMKYSLWVSRPTNDETSSLSMQHELAAEQKTVASDADEDLINETKRLLAGELDPKTRQMLQHAIDEYESTKTVKGSGNK